MAKVGFTTKDGTVVSFTTKKRASRKNATTALATRANGKPVNVPRAWIDAVMEAWRTAPVATHYTPPNSWEHPPYVDIDVTLDTSLGVLHAALKGARKSSAVRRPITVRVYAGPFVPVDSFYHGRQWVEGMWDNRERRLVLPRGGRADRVEDTVAHELVHLLQDIGRRAGKDQFGSLKRAAVPSPVAGARIFGGLTRTQEAGPADKSYEFEAYVSMTVNAIARVYGRIIAHVMRDGPSEVAEDSGAGNLYRSAAERRRMFQQVVDHAMKEYGGPGFYDPRLQKRYLKKVADASAAIFAEHEARGEFPMTTRHNKRKPAKRKPAARKPVKRAPVARGKDKATFKFYVVFRGPPKGLNIHAGFATQQAARAFITKKFRGTRRLQVRGRPGLVKSGFNPKVAANWKTFSLAASLKAAPAPRRRKPTTRRNPESVPGEAQYILNEWASLVRESNAESPTERRARGSATHAMLLFQMIHEHQLQDYIRRYPEAYAAAMKRGGH